MTLELDILQAFPMHVLLSLYEDFRELGIFNVLKQFTVTIYPTFVWLIALLWLKKFQPK